MTDDINDDGIPTWVLLGTLAWLAVAFVPALGVALCAMLRPRRDAARILDPIEPALAREAREARGG